MDWAKGGKVLCRFDTLDLVLQFRHFEKLETGFTDFISGSYSECK